MTADPVMLAALGWASIKVGKEIARRYRVANATFEARITEAAKCGGVYVGEALKFRRTCLRGRLIAESQGKPILLAPSSFAAVGDSESGKSVWITSILGQRILNAQRSSRGSSKPGPVIIVIDANGADSYLPRILQHFCDRAGWTFKFWAGEGGSHLWFPLRDLRMTTPNPAAFGETLALALEAGVGHEHSFWLGRSKRFGARMAEIHPQALTFREMLRHAEDPDDPIWVDKHQADQSAGIVDPIALSADIPSLNASHPTEEQLRSAICLPQDIRRGHTLVYFRFNRNYPLGVATLRILRDSARLVNEGRREKSEVTIFVDESHRLADAAIVDEVLAMGRHSGLRFLTAFQGYAQLREDLQQTILTLRTAFFGSTDGGYTRKKFLEECTTEDFGVAQTGTRSYLTYPALRHEHLEFLSSPAGRNIFLLRVPGGFAYAKALYPVSFQTYCELQDKGFPKVGELPGMIDQSSHF